MIKVNDQESAEEVKREVIIGRNSHVWSVLKQSEQLSLKKYIAIGHRDLQDFVFEKNDRVWIFSYSRNQIENRELLNVIKNAGVSEVVYVASASINVAAISNCYQYPRVKKQAQDAAKEICNARILTIGVFYQNEIELPAGVTAATSAASLEDFMGNPEWGGQSEVNLFKAVERPFKSRFEKAVFRFYGKLISGCGKYPCLLRPLDLVLRQLNMRWYGYLYLSNKLWFTTT